jgi:hypothetical protein
MTLKKLEINERYSMFIGELIVSKFHPKNFYITKEIIEIAKKQSTTWNICNLQDVSISEFIRNFNNNSKKSNLKVG